MSAIEEISARVAFNGLVIGAEARVSIGARETALYLLVTGGGVHGALAARIYGTSKQYVSKVLKAVEDRREDAIYDAAVSELERRIFEEGR